MGFIRMIVLQLIIRRGRMKREPPAEGLRRDLKCQRAHDVIGNCLCIEITCTPLHHPYPVVPLEVFHVIEGRQPHLRAKEADVFLNPSLTQHLEPLGHVVRNINGETIHTPNG